MPQKANTAATTSGTIEIYSPTARFFHWLVVLLIAVQIPVGIYMVYRGKDLNIWDSVTNQLYSGHKLAGVIILGLVALRLLYRLFAGAPAPEPTLDPWQRTISELNHWALYLLLLVVPILGYVGVSMFPALSIFGAFNLPAITAPDKEMSKVVFQWHMYGAMALGGLIALHVAAALYHYVFRRDNVLGRMWPGALHRE